MGWTIPVGEMASAMIVSFAGAGQPSAATDVPVQTPSRRSATVVAPPAVDPEPDAATVDAAADERPADAPTPPLLPDAPGEPSADPLPPPRASAPPPGPAADPFTPSPEDETQTYADPLPPLGEDVAQEEDDEVPGRAKEKVPRLLRPTDKRRFFSMSVGGATASGFASYYSGPVGFQVEGLIGAFSRNRPNFGGGFVVQFRKGFTSELSLAGRLIWDKSLSKHHAIYSSVDTTLGISIPIAVGGYAYPGIPAAQLGVGWGLKAIIAERIALGFRPVAPNLVAPDFYSGWIPVRLRWDFGVSMGIVW